MVKTYILSKDYLLFGGGMSILKIFFGDGDNQEYNKKAFLELASEFEVQSVSFKPNTAPNLVDAAKRLRDMLVMSRLMLRKEEKIRLVKMMNKAKVHALMRDSEEGYHLFRSLDSISSDVTQLL